MPAKNHEFSAGLDPHPALSLRGRGRKRVIDSLVGLLDILLGIAVVGLVVFATAAFGTVKAWSEFYVIATGAGIARALALRVLLAGGLPRTAAYIPIVAFLAIVVLQMIPLPDWLVGAISPQTLADKTRLLSDLPGSSERLRHVTLSYYLLGTHHDLRIILLDVVVFLAVLVIARTPRRMLALLIGFSIVAAALPTEALLQDFLHAPNIMWINGADTVTNSGPFLNHSDFSQQMNHLCGWALALLLVIAGGAWPRGALGRGWRIGGICWLGIVCIAGFVAMLICQSRGGIVCAIIAGGIVLLALVLRRGKRGLVWLVVVVGCVGLAAALCAGFTGIYNHVLSIEHSGEYAQRISNVKDILGISRHYPLLGSGLGTHVVFFPRFESNTGYGLSTYAEVEYAQVLEETGYIGLACVLLFCGIIWVYWKRAVSNAAEPITIAAIGLGFGLAAVQAQSFSDFGQHLPSLGCLTAATCGMLINLGRYGLPAPAYARQGFAWREPASAMVGRAAFAAVVLAAAVWCAVGAYHAKQAEKLFNDSEVLEDFLESNPWFRTPRSNADVLNSVQAAIEQEPMQIGFYIAQGWDRYAALTTPLGTGSPEPDPNFVPSQTIDPNHPDLVKIQQVADALNQARWICPTYGPLCAFVGDMELDPLHAPIGAAHIRLGAELAPHDIQALDLAARLDGREGLWDEAARHFRALLAVRPESSTDVVLFYVNEVHRPDLALEVEPDNYGFLQCVQSNTSDAAVQQAAAARIKELIIAACNGPSPTAEELATLAQFRRADGDLRAAADLYKRAIAQKFDNVGWHLALAQVLLKLGDRDDRADARDEAGICLHLQPGLQPAQDVLDALSSMPP